MMNLIVLYPSCILISRFSVAHKSYSLIIFITLLTQLFGSIFYGNLARVYFKFTTYHPPCLGGEARVRQKKCLNLKCTLWLRLNALSLVGISLGYTTVQNLEPPRYKVYKCLIINKLCLSASVVNKKCIAI
jgi:hypothetical protein